MTFDQHIINYLQEYQTITDEEVIICKKYIQDLCKIDFNVMSCLNYGWNHLHIDFYAEERERMEQKLIINKTNGVYELYKNNNILDLESIKSIKHEVLPHGELHKTCTMTMPRYLCMTILNNQYIIVGDCGGEVNIFDYKTGFHLSNHFMSEASITGLVTYSHNNKNYLFTCDTFGDLLLFEIADNIGNGHKDLTIIKSQSGHLDCQVEYGCPSKCTPPIEKILVNSGKNIVIVALSNLDVQEGMAQHEINGSSYNDLPKSEYIENEILIFNIPDKTLIKRLNLTKKQQEFACDKEAKFRLNDISMLDNSLFACYGNGLVVEWSLDTYEQIKEIKQEFSPTMIKAIDSQTFFVSGDANIKLVKDNEEDYLDVTDANVSYNIESDKNKYTYQDCAYTGSKNNNINDIIKIDTHLYALACNNGSIKIYQDYGTSLVKQLNGHDGKVSCLGLVQIDNNNVLVSASLEGELICWNLDECKN
jgi:WD40 repeat protein